MRRDHGPPFILHCKVGRVAAVSGMLSCIGVESAASDSSGWSARDGGENNGKGNNSAAAQGVVSAAVDSTAVTAFTADLANFASLLWAEKVRTSAALGCFVCLTVRDCSHDGGDLVTAAYTRHQQDGSRHRRFAPVGCVHHNIRICDRSGLHNAMAKYKLENKI